MPGLLRNNLLIVILIINCFFAVDSYSQTRNQLPVYLGENGRLKYTADKMGNRIPDFSYCGYNAGDSDIPDVPVKIFVPHTVNDATKSIQTAIDYVSGLPLNETGFRGTVLLAKGKYLLQGRLQINTSGVVLRGSGIGQNGTILLAAGTDRETLIRIAGKNDLSIESEMYINDPYVAVNSKQMRISSGHSLSKGDRILIHRPTTGEWIDILDMAAFGGETGWLGWKPGSDDIFWDRTITEVNGQSITINAPITTAIDSAYGRGSVFPYSWPGRISNTGIENLCLQSEYDAANPKDEDHCWMAITIESARDCWVRQVTFRNFAGSAVAVYETAGQITVEDCISTHPVSEIGGYRRNTFFTSGQQTLFQRCYAEEGYHDFAVGNVAPGPNAFVQCESALPFSFSGTIDRWASGVLFDLVTVNGQAISFKNRMQEAHGAGWTAANSMIWQSSASLIECYSPPTATNWAFGVWGQFAGNGFWYEANSFIDPLSLYYAQLSDRSGQEARDRAFFLPVDLGSTSSPSVELARKLSDNSEQPPAQLKEWIESASDRNPIASAFKNIITVDQIRVEKAKPETLPKNIAELHYGKLVINNRVVCGQVNGVDWWRGTIRPSGAQQASPHITRFVPGRNGLGYTDNLEEVALWMLANNIIAIDHNYGLWYDRRRDDHERIHRIDGDVWPPFYELPFARSGQGIAWDGLSKYDLTKPNTWYWQRLKDFAGLADQKGFLLIHQHYFQHNILEAGAHWADFPWRPTNNINHTGFPEPPPYAGNKRIYMADQFYDISNDVRRDLHRRYIRQCLSNFSDNSNVIQLISAEYTGPLHFVEFWLDVIMEWEKETGNNALVGLSATKDVQDAILADPVRSQAIDLIDIRYWHYRNDGSLYAPEGGKNLAPRQHERLVKPGKASFESVYRAVSEYRSAHSGMAVLYSNRIGMEYPWAVFMAGGSLAAIPQIKIAEFYITAASMIPVSSGNKDIYILSNPNEEQIIYSSSVAILPVNLEKSKGRYSLIWIDPENGSIVKQDDKVDGGRVYNLIPPKEGNMVLWIRKIQTELK